MRKSLLAVLTIFALAWVVPLAADTATGYSNTFGMNNQAGDTRICPTTSWPFSPYDNNAGWNLLRGQLHCHREDDLAKYVAVLRPWKTISSDALAARYRDAGFYFLAQTSHNEMSPPTISTPGIKWAPCSNELTPVPDPLDPTFSLIPLSWRLWIWAYLNATGTPYCCMADTRYTFGHVLAIGVNSDVGQCALWPSAHGLPDPYNAVERVNRIRANGGLAFIAHPDTKRSPVTGPFSPDWLRYIYERSSPNGVAVYNSAGRECSEGTWDRLLSMGTRAWGYAEDDYHAFPENGYPLGKAWVAVPEPDGVSFGHIRYNLEIGRYYSYWTGGPAWPVSRGVPPYLRVSVDGSGAHPIIYAQLRDKDGNPYNVNSIKFIGRNQRTLHETSGNVADYQCKGWEGYVRVRAFKELGNGLKLNICSQPIFVNGYGVRTSSLSSADGILATSPELILTYVQPDELPTAMPPAGYIGDAFDVSTSDGQLPPGATLDLSYEGTDLSAIGGTQYLAIYRYDTGTSEWVKVGGTVNIGEALITTPITALGFYTISADIPEDTTPSEVFFDSPPYGGIVVEDTTVQVTVNDDLGAYQVSFYMNDHPLDTDTDALDGWSVNLPYADYCTGDWTLKAVAADLAGNMGEAEIPIYINSATPLPTVEITSPADGSTLSGLTTVTGTCWDDVCVEKVELYLDDELVGFGELDEEGTAWTAQLDMAYFVNGSRTLKAVVHDYPGNEASESISVTVSNTATSIGAAKGLADGETVFVDGCIVTAGTPEMGGVFYMQAADRSAGIRVATDLAVNEGDIVSVAGILATENGERQIMASDVAVLSTGNALPDELGSFHRSFKVGLSNTGLLVKVWGEITAVGDGFFYLDDGSNLADGSGNAGIKVYGTPPDDPIGKRVCVTGISGVELLDTAPIPVVRTRRAADVVEITGE